jgi:hypothetical protein
MRNEMEIKRNKIMMKNEISMMIGIKSEEQNYDGDRIKSEEQNYKGDGNKE